ncbi:MAG TPA: tRNA(Ile)-lysidine synthetase, partial [Opitutus sp.]|nr:tRNA(Ile)-lysidine synthetase [Opitutus sp.]
SEIERTLTQSGIRWREDGSNATRRFLRNRVRQQVLPTWYAATPDRDARAGVALSRELLEEDDAALNAWCDELAALSPDGGLNLRRLAGKPQAVVRRVLHRWLLRNFPEAALSRQAFAAILMDLMRGRVGRHSIGCDRFAVIGKTRLTLENLRPKKSR